MAQLKDLGVSCRLTTSAPAIRRSIICANFRSTRSRSTILHPPTTRTSREARAIIGAIASLGAGLDMVVVAEGIETEEQMKLVMAQGVNEGQGYLFSRPMKSDAIRAWLKSPPLEALVA